ncbi:MAG: bifunctional 3,4-dihydroxy-2-butanone-4-phosphate synthase/GTP cyclohydrolase II [Elusimicrobia bacterium]|nr:bifunctional 3,4-dihydroxy-2-butanone-4-phosphate synthase/GTP cyclohydrolase II [Elusimicrobiota bacterium]MDE2236504.1 bifunctional 3,4-dihydroxy-2-butanone-4-phosphate synthase/GTP cyclohydrolase II [Elusimicrobiota bacterium]MDE2424680.1 bifunctional 3,4-dihydroxy-2-butanone-4-phosphate synthase/GTP cyclohydrolase II [Elusimicrobiota bacterium]
MAPRFDSIEDAIADIRQGRMVVVIDDPDRENEGDLVIAAEKCSETAINFMAQHARGLVCVPMEGSRLDQLQLSPMVEATRSAGPGPGRDTAFSVSVDARRGTTTGISARDRATTVRALLDGRTKPRDLIRPGHIFPLRSKDGGVLVRAGHTEAAVDLARLAGLIPAGVICEILNPDGTMARARQLRPFAKRHRLKIVTIKDLIEYRRQHERLVRRMGSARLPTQFGEFALHVYEETLTGKQHLALVKGLVEGQRSVLVRVHSSCITGDCLFSRRCDCGQQLEAALKRIEQEGRGVLVYLAQEGRGIGLLNKIRAYALQDRGLDTVEANLALGFKADLREYGIGAQILVDLGLSTLRILTNNPRKIVGIEGYGLRLVERVPLQVPANKHNVHYIRTKKAKLGHWISEEMR